MGNSESATSTNNNDHQEEKKDAAPDEREKLMNAENERIMKLWNDAKISLEADNSTSNLIDNYATLRTACEPQLKEVSVFVETVLFDLSITIYMLHLYLRTFALIKTIINTLYRCKMDGIPY